MNNPFNKKTEKKMWKSWEEQKNYKKLSNGLSLSDLNDWDKEFFIPEIFGRMKYIQSLFNEFNEMCNQPDLAISINSRLKLILCPEKFNLDLPEPKIGEQYLESVKKMIKEHYNKPITEFINKYSVFVKSPTYKNFISFLNESNFIFDMILQTKAKPFTVQFKSFPSIKFSETNEVIDDEPKEISIILKPFEVRLNELANVCDLTCKSILLWGEKRNESNKNLLNFAASQASIEVAIHQKSTSKWIAIFQLLVIIFIIFMVYIAEQANIYLSNKRLLDEMNTLKYQLEFKKNETDKLKKEIKDIKEKVKK